MLKKNAVIFGGSGFIGMFYANYLIEKNHFNKVFILDIEAPDDKPSKYRNKQYNSNENIIFVSCDVRKKILWKTNDEISLIANFAAVHREPGHQDYEYYETNINGAQNVCDWAEDHNCHNIIFSSSISPYGTEDIQKNEESLPVPVTAYGGSKLVSEKIHLAWLNKNAEERRLIIVRPGVVFGPGEGGNVSRLIKAVKGRYFIYMGNRKVRKAGVYVKELCNAMSWSLKELERKNDAFVLFNMTMNPGPSIEEYVKSIAEILNIKTLIPRIPFRLLLYISYIIDLFLKLFRINHPFSPVRINKLVKSNDILPKYLLDNNYNYIYTLDEALMDWMQDCPEEW